MKLKLEINNDPIVFEVVLFLEFLNWILWVDEDEQDCRSPRSIKWRLARNHTRRALSQKLQFRTRSFGVLPSGAGKIDDCSYAAVDTVVCLNDLYHLDPATLVWTKLDTVANNGSLQGVPPQALSFPAFAATEEEGLWVFGGARLGVGSIGEVVAVGKKDTAAPLFEPVSYFRNNLNELCLQSLAHDRHW